jgi:NADPH:quinone reductase-like Zn-dependent oxidoreductase
MTEQNMALWLSKPGGRFEVAAAPYTPPAAGEVVVRVWAVALNFVDGMPGPLRRVILPWVTYPAVIGSDVAGEVVEVGPGVTRLRPGDRVLGHAFGISKSQNRPAEGAFQHYAVLVEHMVCPIPDSLPFEQAAVLPLTLSTAATGLFQPDHLGLVLPGADPAERAEAVLVWGGSTAVGSNAIQLARNAGYRVVATASPHNFDYLRLLGAADAVDRRSPAAIDEIVDRIGDRPLAGALAIGRGSIGPTVAIAARARGSRRIAAAMPAWAIRLQARRAPRLGVAVTAIWGGTLRDNEVGPAIYTGFLPVALADDSYWAAPEATVAGHGLAAIPDALRQLRRGVSATKLVVTL